MKLVSNIAVSYSTGKLDGSMASGIIEGNIKYVKENPDGSKDVGYFYQVEGTIIKEGSYHVESADVQAMYDSVKASLPADTDIILRDNTKYYEGFKLVAADTFGVASTIWDIVTE
jgi:hypothetical protein